MASEMSGSGCIICSVNASSKKRKKFHGASCEKARNIIDDMINDEFRVTIWSFQETSMDTAYLCYDCEKKILNIRTTEEKLNHIKSDLRNR